MLGLDSSLGDDLNGGWKAIVRVGTVALSLPCVLGLSCSGDSPRELDRIEVSPSSATIARGTSQSFTATGIYISGEQADLTDSVEWHVRTVGVADLHRGQATGRAVGATTILAADPRRGVEGAATLHVTSAVLVSLALTPPSLQLALGTESSLVATGTFSDQSTQELTRTVAWESSSPSAVSISAGLANAVGIGSSTVTATDLLTGSSTSVLVSVTAAQLVAIAVTPTLPTIALGTTRQFTATGTFSDATTQDLTSSVMWDSSSTGVATISNAGGSEGLAWSSAIGSSTIQAIDAMTAIQGTTTLAVTAASLVSIAVTPATPSIALGTTKQFVATGTYTDATTQNLTSSVTWSSSSTGVATISNAGGSAGFASSAAIGSSTIQAIDAGTAIQGATTLTVTSATSVSVAVTPATPSTPLGATRQFTATGTYTDATTQDLTSSVTWSSSSTGVATISNAGSSAGLAASASVGSSTIQATDSGTAIQGTTTLTVTSAALVSIAVTPATPSIALGTDRQFLATGTYTDATTQILTSSVTWSPSSTGVASISNAGGSTGLASSAAIGSSTIQATDAGTTIQGATTLTVTAATLVSIAVTPATQSVALGTTRQFTATGTYTDATTQDLTSSVTWSSSSTGVATISNAGGSEGLASSAAIGSSTIRATDAGTAIQGSTALAVTAAELVAITVTPANRAITVGATEPFLATGSYTDATTQVLTSSVTWSSSSPGVATISNAGGSEGLASGASIGATTITATDPGTGINGTTTLSVLADIAFVAASFVAHATALDLDVATPAGASAGDVLLAAIAIRPSSSTITPPTGWTMVRRVDNTGGAANSLVVYKKIASDSEPSTHRWSFSTSTGSAASISCFRGADETAPADVEGGTNTASGLVHAAPSVTTTVARTMLVTSHAYSSSATWTPPAGMSEAADVASLTPDDATGISLAVNFELRGPIGATGTRAATASSNSDVGNTHTIALSPD